VDNEKASIIAAYKNSLNKKIHPFEMHETTEFSYTHFGKKGKVTAQEINTKSGINSTRFEICC
jgi:hypothetical protein